MLGDWVRTERERLDWSQKELAERVGVAQAQISKIELNQRTRLNAQILSGLARAFGVSVDYTIALQTGDENISTPSLPTPEQRYPPPLRWFWARMTAEERAEVEDHARWVWEQRLRRRRAQAKPVPEVEEEPAQSADEPPTPLYPDGGSAVAEGEGLDRVG